MATPKLNIREATLRTIAMPADANPNGDIFGGWLLSQMDLAASSAAQLRAAGRVVTVGLDAMSFHRPVLVGDQVSCYAEVTRVGRTSLTIHVEAFRRRPDEQEMIRVTEGTFTFVHIDEQGRPQVVPPGRAEDSPSK